MNDPNAEIDRAKRLTESKHNHFEWNAKTDLYECLANRPCPHFGCATLGIRLVMTKPFLDGHLRFYGFQCVCGDWDVSGAQFERLMERRDIH